MAPKNLSTAKRASNRLGNRHPQVAGSASASPAQSRGRQSKGVPRYASQQLIEDMNRSAGKASAVAPNLRNDDSPKKRGRPSKHSNASGSPVNAAKGTGLLRSVPKGPTVLTGHKEPRPSTGLKRRRLTTAKNRTSAGPSSRSNVFDHPGDDEERPDGSDVREVAAPPTKKRKILKKKALNPSPLKGQGVVDVENVPGTNLDDRSVRRSQRNKKTNDIQPAAPKPTAAAESEQHRQQSNRNAAVPRLEGRGQASVRTRDVSPSADAADELPSRSPTPDSEESDYESAQEEQAEEEDNESVSAEDRRRRKEACRGVKRAVQTHSCQEHWAEMLITASDLRSASDSRPKSEAGRAAIEELKSLRTLWTDGATERTVLEQKMNDALKAIRQMSNDESTAQNNERGQDLYNFIIPAFVRLVKAVLKTVQPTDTMTEEEVEPLLQSLHHLLELHEKARTWKPRPKELYGDAVLDKTRSGIAKNAKAVLTKYRSHYDALWDRAQIEIAREKERARLARERDYDEYRKQLSARHAEEFRQYILRARRRSRIRINQQHPALPEGFPTGTHSSHVTSVQNIQNGDATRRPLNTIADIDDFDDNGQTRTHANTAVSDHSRSRQTKTVRLQENDRDADGWTTEETTALVHALQRYTTPDRFERILGEYGAHELRGRDLDDLMTRAAFIKSSMHDLMATSTGQDWRWLQSVPNPSRT